MNGTTMTCGLSPWQRFKATLNQITVLGFGLCAGHAAAIDSLTLGLDTHLTGSFPTLGAGTPWVNATFTDLGFYSTEGGSWYMASYKDSVQLEISTADRRNPASGPALPAEVLASLGLSQYPDFGVFSGSGNLAAGDWIEYLYLNFNPAKKLDHLELGWIGAQGIPYAGASPIGFLKRKDGFAVPGAPDAGLFDIEIRFSAASLGPSWEFGSRLVFLSSDPFGPYGNRQDLDPDDFNFRSAGSSSGGYALAAQLGSLSMPYYDPAIIAAVPEPSTYAMLGVGLAALGFVARRRKAPG